ncbi:hypothetical protein BJF84_03610 [Rhodococcus sp. CUA-806]|nr:hypothetical protein BJF84_03610 [Rhodococcus sp. CUA-806]
MTEPPEFRRERIADPSAELLRPIIHQWVSEDVVNFEAFRLSTSDKDDSNRLSIARAAATSAEQAYHDRATQSDNAAKTRTSLTSPLSACSASM